MRTLTKTCAFAAVTLAAFTAAPAMAQTPIPGLSAHAGAIVGTDKLSVEAGGDKGSTDGMTYGIVAGADFSLPGGGFFIGAEAEYSDSSISESQTDVFTPGDEVSLSAGGNLVLSGRAGVGFPGGVKIYARGGWSKANLEAAYDDGITVVEGEDDLEGLLIGVGAELRVSRFVLRAEYRRTNYSDIDVAPGVTVDPSRSQLLAGVMFGF